MRNLPTGFGVVDRPLLAVLDYQVLRKRSPIAAAEDLVYVSARLQWPGEAALDLLVCGFEDAVRMLMWAQLGLKLIDIRICTFAQQRSSQLSIDACRLPSRPVDAAGWNGPDDLNSMQQ